MQWLALAAAMLAVACYQVGSMSVLVAVLSVVLKVVAIAVAVTALVAGVLFIWRRRRAHHRFPTKERF